MTPQIAPPSKVNLAFDDLSDSDHKVERPLVPQRRSDRRHSSAEDISEPKQKWTEASRFVQLMTEDANHSGSKKGKDKITSNDEKKAKKEEKKTKEEKKKQEKKKAKLDKKAAKLEKKLAKVELKEAKVIQKEGITLSEKFACESKSVQSSDGSQSIDDDISAFTEGDMDNVSKKAMKKLAKLDKKQAKLEKKAAKLMAKQTELGKGKHEEDMKQTGSISSGTNYSSERPEPPEDDDQVNRSSTHATNSSSRGVSRSLSSRSRSFSPSQREPRRTTGSYSMRNGKEDKRARSKSKERSERRSRESLFKHSKSRDNPDSPPCADYSSLPGPSHNPGECWICMCGYEQRLVFKFCGMCGEKQTWRCEECSFDLNLWCFQFCGGCGETRDEMDSDYY